MNTRRLALCNLFVLLVVQVNYCWSQHPFPKGLIEGMVCGLAAVIVLYFALGKESRK